MVKIGDKITIESFKHNGELHRIWKNAIVYSLDEEKIIVIIEKGKVKEQNGREWITKEPAVLSFYFKKWYNVMAMLREDGIYYYCNVASPVNVVNKKLQYIDYDLDLKTYPNNTYRVLDCNEFYCHRYAMNYGETIENIVMSSLDELIFLFKKRRGPFSDDNIDNIYYDFKRG